MMELNEYQKLAARTSGIATDPYKKMKIAVSGLGIAGEAGEVSDLIKKHVGHGHELDKDKLVWELGDVLWYVSDIARLIGFDLEAVARANIAKLMVRYPDGFDPERSINREEQE